MKVFIFIISLSLLVSCQTIAPYSSTAYMQAVQLKVKSLELISKANEPYEIHKQEILSLNQELQVAYEFAKGRRKNQISTLQWKILLDPKRHLLGGFLEFWKDRKQVSSVFIAEFKRVISDAFDTIIGLESGKIRIEDIK